MPTSKHFLSNLRAKPESTKNIIAAVFAILPALLVGYAQFYMNDKNQSNLAVKEQAPQVEGKEMISAVASIGKIFDEGRDSISDALGNLKKIDKKFLEEKSSESVNTDTSSASNTKNVLDEGM